MRLTNILVTVLLFSLLALPAQAGFEFKFKPAPPHDPTRPYNLVCFEKDGLMRVLNLVVNQQQFLRNDLGQSVSRDVRRVMSRGGCSFVQIPPGSKARRAGLYESRKGFIFPLFEVTYGTTDQSMYSADGIFLTKYWRLHRGRRHGLGMLGGKVIPKTCEALDEMVNLSKNQTPPDYVYVPRQCRTYIIR